MDKGRVLFCVFLIALASYAIYAASGWSFKTGFFPLAVSIPLLVIVVIQLFHEISGKKDAAAGAAIDLEFSSDVPPEVARRRVLTTFAWIVGFIVSVYLIGFPLTVPLFIFTYLWFQSEVSWARSLALTAITWLFFHGLFERVVHIQFGSGAIQTWLGM
jgi:TRAP-type C4-dicarboxylate transport system permease small subunit